MNENKTHLGIYGIVANDGKILLIKKSRGPYKGLFDLPGGKLEHGEQFEDGLRREIREETGLEVSTITLRDNFTVTVEFNDAGKNISMYHVGLIYEAKIADGSVLNESINEEDSLGPSWHDVSAINPNDLSPFAKKAVALINAKK
jgi:8-oxo-dGTP diphosphatase